MNFINFPPRLYELAVSKRLFIAIPWQATTRENIPTIPLATVESMLESLPNLASLANAFELAFADRIALSDNAFQVVLGPKAWLKEIPKVINAEAWESVARSVLETGKALAGIGQWEPDPDGVDTRASNKEAKRRRNIQRSTRSARIAISRNQLRVAVPATQIGGDFVEVKVEPQLVEASRPARPTKKACPVRGNARGWDGARGLVLLDGRYAVEESMLDKHILEQVKDGKEPMVTVEGFEHYDAPNYRVFRKS